MNYENLRGLPTSVKLQRLRYWRGLSQRQLANEIGCNRVSISMWETGKQFPRGYILEKIRLYYNLPLDFFIEDENKNRLRNRLC